MVVATVQYRFRQRFPYPAGRAFRWCVDYQSDDPRLEGLNGIRSVRRLTVDTVLLGDTFFEDGGASVTKTKLVRIRARDRSWTSTHLAGPNRFSQFWYRIVPESRSTSHLEYSGLHVERFRRSPSPKRLHQLRARLSREDATAWRALARAMKSDLG